MFLKMTKFSVGFFWVTILAIVCLVFCKWLIDMEPEESDKDAEITFVTIQSFGVTGLDLCVAYEQWEAGYYASFIAFAILIVIFFVVLSRNYLFLPKNHEDHNDQPKDKNNAKP